MARKKPDLSKFTSAQIQAAQMYCDQEHQYTNKEIADAAGISERQWYRWKENEDFIELINYMNEKIMDTFAVETYRALRTKVRKGDVKAIELAMKRMGVLIDRKEIQSDVKVEHELIAGKTNDQLAEEVAAKERALLGDVIDTVEVAPAEYEPVTDESDGEDTE